MAVFNGFARSGSDVVDVVEIVDPRLAKEGTSDEILSMPLSLKMF